jgi:two-component system response regulator AtoC
MGRSTDLRPPPPHEGDPNETRSVVAGSSETDAPEPLCLLVSSEDGVRVERLDLGRFILGRDEGADILIHNASVSRKHATLVVERDRVTICDLDSRNGTRFQGRRLASGEPVELYVGASFELGQTTIVLQRAAAFLASGATRALSPPKARDEEDGPVVRDPAMKRLYGLLDVIAPSPIAVLILGETGVGKEVFALSVHRRSERANKPFLQLNCAAFPETMLEGELFGYESGAFTGARHAKPGLLESADGGTVLLDEVGEIPLSTQAKLLRVLQSGEVLRLGALKPRHVDVRIISATNRDLRALIIEKLFRSDLFFRLKGMTLRLPPLRKRKADILPLAHLFMARVAARLKRPAPLLTPEAERALEAYLWPGNVRELQYEIERAVTVCQGSILDAADFELDEDTAGEELPGTSIPVPPSETSLTIRTAVAARTEPIRYKAPTADVSRDAVLDALNRAAGNQSEAARMLGISRRALIYRIEQFGIARPRKR